MIGTIALIVGGACCVMLALMIGAVSLVRDVARIERAIEASRKSGSPVSPRDLDRYRRLKPGADRLKPSMARLIDAMDQLWPSNR
jgi:hypothetical protein